MDRLVPHPVAESKEAVVAADSPAAVCLSNAFVALISPRAYRGQIDVEQALNQLLQEAGRKHERHVVAALFHVAENRSHWSEW